MGDLLSEFGDLVFTLVIGYMGAVEFLYVVRHLYHWSCNHEGGDVNDADSLARLQENMRQQLATATATEQAAGKNAMQDGVLYENGFRVDPNQADIDNLKEQLNNKSAKDMKRQELEKELDKQKQIAEKTRKELQEAEAEVARQQREAEENERKIREAEQNREREQKQREEEKKRIAEEKERKLQEEKKQKEEADKRKAKEEEERKQQAAEDEKRKAEEERLRKEDEENARKLKEAEEEREREQQRREEEEENARQLLEAERLREQQQRQAEEAEAEREANEKRMLEAERLREQQQRQAEEEAEREENEKRMLEAERQMEEKQREAEDMLEQEERMLDIERRLEEQLRDSEGSSEELTDNERQLIASIKQRDIAEQHDEASAQKEAELLKRILQAREQLGEESEEEQSQRLFNLEEDREQKQKRIDENARLFLEAEKEMTAMQEMMEEAVQRRDFGTSLESAPQTPVVEEPCVKKIIYPLEDDDSSSPPVSHKVKTQLAQSSDDSYSVSTKSLLFPGVSDDASSNEPISSQQSSFSTQHSEEVTTGNESQYLQQERQEPDGEDTNFPQQYSDDYLRSLDGIKSRPLSREDRSGRRIAFKKRRSSGSSNSSRDSRASRDEELKMFSSLEEEEMRNTAESPPLRYSNELKVKGHHRRHKRSPAKDMKSADESLRSSLERLGEEEAINPWGDVVPEHYKDTAFWKREKAVSIEEEREMEKPTSSEELNYDTATNLPSASSFEEATQIQNEKALNNLRNQDNKDIGEEDSSNKASKDESARSDNNINLQTSTATEKEASPSRSSASPRLRRSPRIEEMNQYEERWKESNEPPRTAPGSTMNTPTISVQTPLDFGPWRDEYGLIKEGLSDFYDFTASVNPSRSRSTSRNPSPANTAPNTPQPKNVSYETNHMQENGSPVSIVEVYDDTNQLDKDEFIKDNINKFLDSLQENESPATVTDKVSAEDVFAEDTSAEDNPTEDMNAEDMSTEDNTTEDVNAEDVTEVPETSPQHHLQYVVDDLSREKGQSFILPMVNIIDDSTATAEESNTTDTDNNEEENALAENLRSRRNRSNSHSRSRSKSPLPTADNIQRSLETRRNKMIRHNEDVREKLIESNLMPETLEAPATPSDEEDTSKESMTLLVESLRAERSRSRSRSVNYDPRSRSRSKSPLPSPDNIQRSLETRRNKMIKHNDEVYDKLVASHLLPESTERPATQAEDEDCSKESMTLLVESLRAERSRSRSRSRCRSPIPSTENIEIRVEGNGDLFEKFSEQMRTSEIPPVFIAPLVSIEVTEPPNEEEEYSRESMDSLVQSLRVARSRSRSKSPMRLPTSENLSKSLETRRSKLIEINDGIREELQERARTPEPPQLTVEYVYEFVETSEDNKESSSRTRMSRSRTPSRSPPHPSKSPEVTDGTPFSRNPSRSVSPSQDDSNFHVMLNLEGSQNKTLSKNSEEYESTLADRLKQLDEEALDKLKNASEEIELRTLSPVIIGGDGTKEQEENDLLADLPMAERRKMLRISPTTPDYDRTISEEMKDVERIKQERIVGGFKRSTYVGESMDFVGPEYESMRREAARFQRSRSPTPSFSESPVEPGQMTAAEKRHIQDLVLAELTVSSETRNTGAKPKVAGMISTDSEASLELEEMRRRNAEFRRSASKSRSPLGKAELAELAAIEAETARRELKDRVLDEISNINFQDFSRQLNPNFLDNDRRASDSALIGKPEILLQLQDNDDIDMDPEEYHHFRRFSLAQEQPIEEYPSDDYIFIQQVEVRTRSGSRTWTREDFYSQDINDLLLKGDESAENVSQEIIDVETGQEERVEQIITTADEVEEDSNTKSKDTSPEAAGTEDVDEAEDDIDEYVEDDENNEPYEFDDDEESNGSEDDRRTVIEVDDEIDEDISDFNERGPADESHHEQSECEEAEREMDRYAGREASDWAQVMDVGEIFPTEQAEEEALMVDSEGAVGGASGSPYDSDSFAIDQIYDEAIRNRKQSGILREFDSILNEMSSSSIENSIKDMDEQYALWSKTQKKSKNIKLSSSFIESERRDTEMRYLGDANVSARQSTRLRSRYGYNPVLQSSTMPDDIEVDMNYKPKREYNWRKNFRLSDDDVSANQEHLANNEETQNDEPEVQWDLDARSNDVASETYDVRKYSLDGESITLFSQSPEKTPATDEPATVHQVLEEIVEENATEDMVEEKVEKPKKKKTKKKTRKGSKGSVEALSRDDDNDNDDYERPAYSRRSSSIHMETDSPKRISRSRRSSRSSLTNEDSFGMYSPRSSVGFADPITDIMEEYSDVKETARPKKIKKRKKVKEIMADVTESLREEMTQVAESEVLQEFEGTASTVITPDSAADNVLATLSPQESICVTPGSLESEISLNSNQTTNSSSSATSAISVTTPVDTFDILKDANFYPLF